MVQPKLMYTPSDKETGKEKWEDFLKFLNTVLIVGGVIGMLAFINKFCIAVKPAFDFDTLRGAGITLFCMSMA